MDKYLGTQTEINLYDTSEYNFIPDPDTNSYRNRFMLVFNNYIGANNKKPINVRRQQGLANTNETRATICPNPVAGKTFKLVLHNVKKGDYIVNMYTVTGRLVLTRSIKNKERANTYALKLPASITAGNYMVKIINSSGNIIGSVPVLIGR